MVKNTSPYIKANQTKRFIAYIVDWFIGSLMIMLPISIYYLAMTADIDNVSNVNINVIFDMFGKSNALVIGLVALICGLIYYLITPFFLNGQTIGKRFLELKIVNQDESNVSFKTLFIRQFIVLVLLETYIFSISHLLIYMLELAFNSEVFSYYYLCGMILSIISCLMATFGHKHLALHDLIASTKVVGVNSKNVDQKI